jgi:hypothetical protein
MNNVLNRKMFVNRNARAKLANMGGILASSPEMVDATQRFAPGGTVTTDASGATGTFTVDPQPSFLERLREDIMKKIRNNEPFTEQDRQVIETINNGSGGIMQKIDEIFAPNAKTAREERGQNIIESNLPLGDADDEATAILDIPLASAEILSEPEIAPERINVNSAELLDTSDNDRARRGPGRTAMDFSTETIPTASVDDDEASLMERIDEIFAPAAKGNREDAISTIADFNEAEKQGAAMGAAAEVLTPPSPYEEKIQKKEDDADRAERIAAEDEAFAQDVPPAPFVGEKNKGEVYEGDGKWTIEEFLEGREAPPDLSSKKIVEKIKGSSDLSEDMANAVGDALGEDFEGMDMPERISSYKKVLSDLLGTDTKEDKKEEFWMNMAMVGFAVAAGDDPSAIKNIADGLLAGSKMMKQDKASNQARQDKINMLALEESNKDKRLAARLRSAKTLAGIKAAGETGMRNYKSPIDAIQFKENELATAIDNGTLVLKEGETIQSLALASVIPLYEAMGVDMSTFKTLGSSTATEAEDDGLVEVVQNGNTFRVPTSQIK